MVLRRWTPCAIRASRTPEPGQPPGLAESWAGSATWAKHETCSPTMCFCTCALQSPLLLGTSVQRRGQGLERTCRVICSWAHLWDAENQDRDWRDGKEHLLHSPRTSSKPSMLDHNRLPPSSKGSDALSCLHGHQAHTTWCTEIQAD